VPSPQLTAKVIETLSPIIAIFYIRCTLASTLFSIQGWDLGESVTTILQLTASSQAKPSS